MELKSTPLSNEDKKSDLKHPTNENKIKTSSEEQASSTMTSDASKGCDVTDKDTSDITIIPKIKTSEKIVYPSSSTDPSKEASCDVKDEQQGDDAYGAVVTNIPKSEQTLIKKDPGLDQVSLHFVSYTLINYLIDYLFKIII